MKMTWAGTSRPNEERPAKRTAYDFEQSEREAENELYLAALAEPLLANHVFGLWRHDLWKPGRGDGSGRISVGHRLSWRDLRTIAARESDARIYVTLMRRAYRRAVAGGNDHEILCAKAALLIAHDELEYGKRFGF